MAGIDKTWVTGEQYKLVRRWAYEYGEFTIPYINFKEKVSNYINEYDEIPEKAMLWNTPGYFDVFLRHNCPFDFIQKKLKEQYGDSYDSLSYGKPFIKNNEPVVQIEWNDKIISRRAVIYIILYNNDDSCIFYNTKPEYFTDPCTYLPFDESEKYYGKINIKKAAEDISKFNLPIGSKIEMNINDDYTIKGIVKAMI